MDIEIKKILIRKDGIKYLIVPKNSKLKAGELILMTNDLNIINKYKREVKNE
jgi:hypothetical protein